MSWQWLCGYDVLRRKGGRCNARLVGAARRRLRFETLEERAVLSMASMTGALVLPAESSALAGPLPVGNEFRVNATAQGSQLQPTIAVDDAGQALVVFSGWGPSGTGVYGQRFDANGNALGGELLLLSESCGTGGSVMAMRGDGQFVVVRTSIFTDGDGHGIEARLFNANGTPRGAAFQVNVTTADNQEMPAVAMDAAGNFVVVWQSPDGDEFGVYLRRYAADGTPLSGEVRINSSWQLDQEAPDVAMDDAGNFVVVWYNSISNGDSAIVGRLFGSDGSSGGEFIVSQVHSGSWHAVDHPAVARNGSGRFVVAWSQVGADGEYFDINARRFDSNGGALSSGWQVNGYTTNSQREPDVGIDDRGDFVITWQSYGQDVSSLESWGAYAKSYDSAGQSTSGEILVTTTTESDQTHPVVALDNAQMWMAWESLPAGTDTDGGILAQRYTVPYSARPEDLVLDFGTGGIWLWKNGGAWQFLHAGNPVAMVTGDFDGDGRGDVAVSFGTGNGTWLYYADNRWEFLHRTTASTMASGDMNADGRSELVIGFADGGGTWEYIPATRGWRYLHRLTPSAMACGDVDGDGRADVVMALPSGNGSWVWKNESTWQFLHSVAASAFRAGDLNGDGRAEVVVSFPSPNGLWTYANGGLWTFVHSSTPNALELGDVNGDGRQDLIISFSAGTWEYTPWTKAWKYLHRLGCVSIATGDVDGSGKADVILAFSSNGGTWAFKNESAWQYLHSKSPEAMDATEMDATLGGTSPAVSSLAASETWDASMANQASASPALSIASNTPAQDLAFQGLASANATQNALDDGELDWQFQYLPRQPLSRPSLPKVR